MALVITLHIPETSNILDILKQSSDKEICNCNSGSKGVISYSCHGVSSIINSNKEETAVEKLGHERVKRSRF
jgi:hypothetical protein